MSKTKSYFKVIITADPGDFSVETGYTSFSECFETLSLAEDAVIFNSGVNNPLDKGSKLIFTPDGEEDNNGDRDYKCSMDISSSTGQLSNTDYSAISGLHNQTMNAFFFDERSLTVLGGLNLKLSFTNDNTGNEYCKYALHGEQTGALADLQIRNQYTE